MEASLGYAGHAGLMVSCLLDNMFGHVMTLGNPGGEAQGKVNAPWWGSIQPVFWAHHKGYAIFHGEMREIGVSCALKIPWKYFPKEIIKVILWTNGSYPIPHPHRRAIVLVLPWPFVALRAISSYMELLYQEYLICLTSTELCTWFVLCYRFGVPRYQLISQLYLVPSMAAKIKP